MTKESLTILAREIDKEIQRNDFEKARILSTNLVKKNRSAGLAYLGVIALKEGNYDISEQYLIESFQLNAKQHLALANLVPVYIKKKDFKKAVAYGEQAYGVMPKNLSVCANFAAALMQEQDFARALAVLEPLYDEDSPNVSVITGLIACYRSLFRSEEAERLLIKAEALYGDRTEVVRLKADTLAERNPKEALAAFEKSLELDPENIATHWNMSLVQLRLEQFKEGWINYDYGLLPEVGKIGRPLPKLFEGAQRITKRDQIDPDKWTFAVCEQGIGDQVLFLGCFDQFTRDYPKTILISEKRLRPIYQRSFPTVPMYTYGVGQILAANSKISNGYIPIGSMQKLYRNSKEDFERTKKVYLKPNLEKVSAFRKKLLEQVGDKKIVGFSWKGGYWERAQKTKTLPIEHWEPIFKNEKFIFVSLQYGDVSQEKDFLSSKYKNIRWIEGLDFKKDLDGWFALMCACDEIVSVSTALVHFAGAAGIQVKLLLSDRGAPFIWGLSSPKSIAYPNIDIFRKTKDQSERDFFSLVAKNIN